MVAGTGKNGQMVAEENVHTLIAVLDRYREKPLPRYHGELNKSRIAEEAGFDRKVFHTNPRCAQLLEAADEADRKRYLSKLMQAELAREDNAKVDNDRAALEAQNLRLMAENMSLRTEVERLRRLESLMIQTGRLPP